MILNHKKVNLMNQNHKKVNLMILNLKEVNLMILNLLEIKKNIKTTNQKVLTFLTLYQVKQY